MSLLEELYSEDLIGDPETLDEAEERGEPLFLEDEGNEQNDGDAVNDHVLQTVPQSDNPVKPKRKVVKNPQPKLDAQRLRGPRGLMELENIFKNYKFCGKGNEKKDLNQIMKRLEHWAHRLFPKYEFDDCLEKLESLGHKRPVMVYLKKIRMDLETAESSAVEPIREENDDLALPLDPFDELLSQQISEAQASTSVGMPPQSFASSQCSIPSSPQPTKIVLTDEQRKRMESNRLIAQERRLLRLKELQEKQKQHENSTAEIADTTGGRNDEIQTNKGLEVPTTESESNEEGNVSLSQPVESVSLTPVRNPEVGPDPFRVISEENATMEIAEATGKGSDEIPTSKGHKMPATAVESESNEEGNVSQPQPMESVPLTAVRNPEVGPDTFKVISEENSTMEIVEVTGESSDEIQTSEGHKMAATAIESESNKEGNVSQPQPMESVPLTAVRNPEVGPETFKVISEENATMEIAEATGEGSDEIPTSEGHKMLATAIESESNEVGNVSQPQPM